MAVFPTIVDGFAVEVTTNNSSLSYQQLISTLNFTAYQVKALFMQASSIGQVSTQFKYQKRNQTGHLEESYLDGNIDPYQFLPVLDLLVDGNDFILTDMTVVAFTLLPDAFITMYFVTEAVSFEQLLNMNTGMEPAKKTEMIEQAKKLPKGNGALIMVSAVGLTFILLKILKEVKP